jgi:hypothetical protein
MRTEGHPQPREMVLHPGNITPQLRFVEKEAGCLQVLKCHDILHLNVSPSMAIGAPRPAG